MNGYFISIIYLRVWSSIKVFDLYQYLLLWTAHVASYGAPTSPIQTMMDEVC